VNRADQASEELVDQQIGPREVGGRYRSGYWGDEYEVVAIDRNPATTWMAWSITVRDVNGQRTHCTAWDPTRDRVIS
jgi:hypothetical protein